MTASPHQPETGPDTGADRGEDVNPETATGGFYEALMGFADPTGDPANVRRQTLALLQSIGMRLQYFAKVSADRTGIHPTDLQVLIILYRANPDHCCKVAAIQRGLGFTSGGMTRRLNTMVEKGFVERLADPEDGRAWLARLTPAGRAVSEALLSDTQPRNLAMLSEFSPQEWTTMIDLLKRLNRVMQESSL